MPLCSYSNNIYLINFGLWVKGKKELHGYYCRREQPPNLHLYGKRLLLADEQRYGEGRRTEERSFTSLKLFKSPRQLSTATLDGELFLSSCWLLVSGQMRNSSSRCSSSPVSDSSLILDMEHRRRYIRWYMPIWFPSDRALDRLLPREKETSI